METKNKKGWIFGSEKQPSWTQSIYGKKYSFQNLLRQTFRQKKILSEFLNSDESNIHTVIYFVGDCKFKTPLPDNAINSGVGRFIKRFQNQIPYAPFYLKNEKKHSCPLLSSSIYLLKTHTSFVNPLCSIE